MKAICINTANRPNEVPANRWLILGKEYTIIEVKKLTAQGGILGVKLAEINNDDLAPWQYFRADRFAVIEPEKTKENSNEEVLL